MSLTTTEFRSPPAAQVAQRFLEALREGRIIDALDSFAPEAIIQEDLGQERHGLRAIALSLLPYRTPGRVDVLEIRPSADGATAHVRTRGGPGSRAKDYRATFGISGRRIRVLRLKAI